MYNYSFARPRNLLYTSAAAADIPAALPEELILDIIAQFKLSISRIVRAHRLALDVEEKLRDAEKDTVRDAYAISSHIGEYFRSAINYLIEAQGQISHGPGNMNIGYILSRANLAGEAAAKAEDEAKLAVFLATEAGL